MASDNFTGTNGTALTTYDANWILNAGDFSIQTNALAANGATGTTECAARYAGTYPNDHFAEAALSAVAAVANARIGVAVRCATDASANYYGLYYDHDAGETYLFKVVAGAWTQLGASFTAGLSVGDTLRLDVTGTTLTYLLNGVSQGTRSDSDLSSGSPGVAGKGLTTGHRLDDWLSTDANPSTTTFYLNNPVQGGSSAGLLDMSAPTASTSTTGWTVGTTAATRYSRVTYNAEVGSANFTVTAQPSGAPSTSAQDCYRLSAITSGSFSAGTWYSSISVIAVSSGGVQDGRARFRLWRSANADGSSPTEITQGTMIGSRTTNLSASVAQTSSASTQISAVTLTDEYLLMQIAWETL